MEAINRLKAQAKARRDAAVERAEQDYYHALREIRVVERRLARDSPRPRSQKRFKAGSAVAVAEAVLRKRGPLTLIELAVAVREQGYRRGASDRRLIENLRSGMSYHRTRFQRVDEAWVALG